ncbi:hypothetical protein ECC02_010418 [Trypanosoma cruzi]|uniref:Mucin TcMUCII n=1 Tax=Trypanosoma cruzi TaxID=5693 RepID=A0A7J6XQQ7_TRYCR|nr:hypothetical protein ECC02_010418 [Trypanosoma cruzi]
MTTCRLLCALLVLALCCCTSVCAEEAPTAEVTETAADAESDGGSPSSTPETNLAADRGANPMHTSPSRPSSGTALQASLQSNPLNMGSATEPENTALDGRGTAGPGKQSVDTKKTLLTEGMDGTPGPESGTRSPVDQKNMKAEDAGGSSQTTTVAQASAETITAAKARDSKMTHDFVQTTTTTTNTTTTTTTTAPEAQSNTAVNTEASTTTTTRAPSRLREVDGSLSSSAWVCAPLLLAVSALACTAVG